MVLRKKEDARRPNRTNMRPIGKAEQGSEMHNKL